MKFLVTTDSTAIPDDRPIVMVDGTVPNWQPRPQDFHWDHHRPGGGLVQIDEIPVYAPHMRDVCFVTTQVDADACVAAAWLMLAPEERTGQARRNLWMIACDCDHLGLPEYGYSARDRQFARNAVAALKLHGEEIADWMKLPAARKEWTPEQKQAYASNCFRDGSEWLYQAALSQTPYPGKLGEAVAYWAKVEEMRSTVYSSCFEYCGVACFDSRGIDGYVDPRLLVDWARQHECSNITLVIRDGSRQPNAVNHPEQFSYTLGSVPLHPEGSPKFSDRGVWEALAQAENAKRLELGLPAAQTKWGGRNEVGGSGWRDPAVMDYSEVVNEAWKCLKKCS